jgi:hypothetical protein
MAQEDWTFQPLTGGVDYQIDQQINNGRVGNSSLKILFQHDVEVDPEAEFPETNFLFEIIENTNKLLTTSAVKGEMWFEVEPEVDAYYAEHNSNIQLGVLLNGAIDLSKTTEENFDFIFEGTTLLSPGCVFANEGEGQKVINVDLLSPNGFSEAQEQLAGIYKFEFYLSRKIEEEEPGFFLFFLKRGTRIFRKNGNELDLIVSSENFYFAGSASNQNELDEFDELFLNPGRTFSLIPISFTTPETNVNTITAIRIDDLDIQESTEDFQWSEEELETINPFNVG